MRVWQLMRVHGIHFDQGEPWTLQQLQELGGLFEFKDIWDRLPFPKGRVERWILNRAHWPGVFHPFPVGPNRSTTYIDLRLFMQSVATRLQGTEKGA